MSFPLRSYTFVYPLHPVNVVAKGLLSAGNLYCRGELTLSEGCRTDVRWLYDNGSQMTTIASLEVKNTKVLHPRDFRDAMTTPNNARAKRDTAQGQGTSYTFSEKCVLVIKAGEEVHRSAAISDVAIFDRGTMFVFDFGGMNENALDPVLARGIWFSESGSNHGQGQSF